MQITGYWPKFERGERQWPNLGLKIRRSLKLPRQGKLQACQYLVAQASLSAGGLPLSLRQSTSWQLYPFKLLFLGFSFLA